MIANMQSKSTLWTVAGDICARHRDYVTYWPSYEYAITRDVFEEDGRHVQRAEVSYIVDNFKKTLSASCLVIVLRDHTERLWFFARTSLRSCPLVSPWIFTLNERAGYVTLLVTPLPLAVE